MDFFFTMMGMIKYDENNNKNVIILSVIILSYIYKVTQETHVSWF
jgi:hypothetical protein